MSHNILARFYGGSWDGETKYGNYAAADRVYVAIGDGSARRELYERVRGRLKSTGGLAYRFVCVEDVA